MDPFGAIFDNNSIKCSRSQPIVPCNNLVSLYENNANNDNNKFFYKKNNNYKKRKNYNKPDDVFMEMINTQDFIEGFWGRNEYTKK